jgi:ribosome-binding protein aMBF1 (putative translation factor)
MIINGQKLREYREKAFLSQTDLAAKVKANRSVISHYENGKVSASLKRIRVLAKALKCEPEELVVRE